MERCKQNQLRLAERGPTLPDQDPQLREHIQQCPNCAAFLSSLKCLQTAAEKVFEWDPLRPKKIGYWQKNRLKIIFFGILLVFIGSLIVSMKVSYIQEAQWGGPTQFEEFYELANSKNNQKSAPEKPPPIKNKASELDVNLVETISLDQKKTEEKERFGARRPNVSPPAPIEQRAQIAGNILDKVHTEYYETEIMDIWELQSREIHKQANQPFLPTTVPILFDPRYANTSHSQNTESKVQPDPHPLEKLEQYPLESLQLIETKKINGIQRGLIRAKPLGGFYIVSPGDYMGQNNGRIISIQKDFLTLNEKIQVKPTFFEERPARLHTDETVEYISTTIKRSASDSPRLLAQQFLKQRRTQKDLTFQKATGYWENTYIPGDQAMRLLQARLQRWNRSELAVQLRDPAVLEGSVQPNWQPFDPPKNAALALYLQTDRSGIQQSGRLLLQVGIQGSAKKSGLRPVLNLCVVLDLREPSSLEIGKIMRVLLLRLQKVRQPGDRFSLVVAGRSKKMALVAREFRHGPLQRVLQTLFKTPEKTKRNHLNLSQAITLAMANVRSTQSPNTTLGTSLVLLISASSLGDITAIEALAHRQAMAGTHTSIVTLGGSTIEPSTAQRLVRAGQGNWRILTSPKEVPALLDRELHAASRTVARALRLRIRLSAQVKLIEIRGSRRLQAPQAKQVREMEQSIDLRLAQNLGIHIDRGQDEEGIQIVIPKFHAGDSHVVLLDVITEGPGSIADVTLRYKDLVFLRNGQAHVHLHLPAKDGKLGSAQLNVLKNDLAWHLAQTAEKARIHLLMGRSDISANYLREERALYHSLRQEIPSWFQDAELLNDERMLGRFIIALNKAPQPPDRLADALAYMAFHKLIKK